MGPTVRFADEVGRRGAAGELVEECGTSSERLRRSSSLDRHGQQRHDDEMTIWNSSYSDEEDDDDAETSWNSYRNSRPLEANGGWGYRTGRSHYPNGLRSILRTSSLGRLNGDRSRHNFDDHDIYRNRAYDHHNRMERRYSGGLHMRSRFNFNDVREMQYDQWRKHDRFDYDDFDCDAYERRPFGFPPSAHDLLRRDRSGGFGYDDFYRGMY